MDDFDVSQAKSDFDDFLFLMDDQLDELDQEAARLGLSLDLTMNSLETLERLFLQLTECVSDDIRARLIVMFARYVGEIVRETYGGKWQLSLGDPKDVHFNLPVIVGHTKFHDSGFSPIHAVRALSLRKNSGLLRKIVQSSVQPRELSIGDIEEK